MKEFKVKIPSMSKAEDGAPLQWILSETARQCEMTPHDVGVVMSFFLENIVRAMCKGWLVRIPGFGIFGAYTRWPKIVGSYPFAYDTTKPSVCYPRFQAARGFLNEISISCGPSLERNNKMYNYQKSHAFKAVESGKRVFTALGEFRKCMESQANKFGLSVLGAKNA